MRKKRIVITVLSLVMVMALSTVVSAGFFDWLTGEKDEAPNLKVGYVFTNHQTPLMVAAKKGKEIEKDGTYLKELVARKKYALIKDGEKLANLELVEAKSGSETMTMMAQGHLDLGFASSAANIAAMDKGTKIKMLCPVHTEGIGLVVAKDSSVNNWNDFKQLLNKNDEPVKVGYHSPTSAPLILFEAAIKRAGITYTSDPQDSAADILLVDLKGTKNLIPALNSQQVDAWVGPSPYPSLAATKDVGKIALKMKHLPPEGQWYDFPCCVASASEKLIQENPKVVDNFVKVIAEAADYSENNKNEAAEITAKWTGVPEKAAKISSIKYTARPSEVWIKNVGLVYNSLQTADRLNKNFVDAKYADVKDELYDFSFIKTALEQ